MAFSSPKNPWALHARGRTLNGRGLGPQNPMCWRARILRVPKEPLFDELGGLFTGTVVTSGRDTVEKEVSISASGVAGAWGGLWAWGRSSRSGNEPAKLNSQERVFL